VNAGDSIRHLEGAEPEESVCGPGQAVRTPGELRAPGDHITAPVS